MNGRCTIQCELEPVFLSCGPNSVALGLNNHSWLYSSFSGQLLRKFQFVASVQSISLNESYVAVLVDGKVYLQHVPTVFHSFIIRNSITFSAVTELEVTGHEMKLRIETSCKNELNEMFRRLRSSLRWTNLETVGAAGMSVSSPFASQLTPKSLLTP